MVNIKIIIASFIISSLIYLFGDFGLYIQSLFLFMLIDILTGCINAFVFKHSSKTETGAGSSFELLKGFFKKFLMIVCVAISYRLDIMLEINFIKNSCIIYFILTELTSIIENFGLMGIPIPDVIQNALDLLKKKGEKNENSE